MNSFQTCQQIEAAAMRDIVPNLFSLGLNFERGKYVIVCGQGDLAIELQKFAGDIFVNSLDGKFKGIEVKAETADLYGNFFLELWSNAVVPYIKPGWMRTCHADLLFYYFLREKSLYIIDFKRLSQWAFGSEPQRIFQFPVKNQARYSQLNLTRGACVPIEIIRKEVGFLGWFDLGLGKAGAA